MRFRDFRLGIKLSTGFGLVLVIMAVAHFYAVNRMAAIKGEVDRISDSWLPRAMAIAEVNVSIARLRSEQLQHAITPDEDEKQELADRMIELIDQINDDLATYEELAEQSREQGARAATETALYAAFEGKWESYQDLFVDFIRFSLRNEQRQALELLNGRMRNTFEDFSTDLEELVRANRDNTLAAARRTEASFMHTRAFTTSLLISGILLSFVIGGWLVRYISVPVQKLEQAAHSVAEGEIDVQLDVDSGDEIGSLAQSFNRMTAALRARANEVKQANAALADKNRDLEQTVTQLQEAQQQLVMQEKMASLGNLVAGVAHEINNPVGAISSAAQTSDRSIEIVAAALDEADLGPLAENRRFTRALEVLKRNSGVAVTAAERIEKIVLSLRSFARLDEAEFQRADLHDGLDSTLTLLDHVLKNRVEVVRQYDEIPEIDCFPNQLNQVFMNVLSNAAHAIEGPGTITIDTRLQDNEIRIGIADTGKGIVLEHQAQIFDPGFTTKGVGVGTGLGLSISYNIVQRHKGRMVVQSEVGKGTEMAIYIPTDLVEPAEDVQRVDGSG